MKRPTIFFVAFFSGCAIMGVEILSARQLAPYIGTSLTVWSTILSVSLAALALGSWFGGYSADKKDNKNTSDASALLFLLSGISLLIIPFCLNLLWTYLKPIGFADNPYFNIQIITASLCLSVVALGLPLFFLGGLLPYLIKYQTRENSSLGKISGSLSALSTSGGIVATLITSILLIPSFGNLGTTIIFFSSLLVTSFFLSKNLKVKIIILILLTAGILYLHNKAIQTNKYVTWSAQSPYHDIQIVKGSGQKQYLEIDGGRLIQTVYDPTSIFTGFYYDTFSQLPSVLKNKENPNILILGLGGGTIARQLKYFYPQSTITGVELDKMIVEAAEKKFSFNEKDFNIIIGDANNFIQQGPKNKYDLIIVDLYQDEVNMPWEFTTLEFWQKINKLLNSAGVLACNFIDYTSENKIEHAFTNTQAKIFPFVYNLSGFESENNLLIASNRAVDLNLLGESARKNNLNIRTQDIKIIQFDKNKIILTDDKPYIPGILP